MDEIRKEKSDPVHVDCEDIRQWRWQLWRWIVGELSDSVHDGDDDEDDNEDHSDKDFGWIKNLE